MLTKYYSGDKSKKNGMGGAFSTHESERRGAYRVSVWRPEGKRPLGSPRRIRDDNIKKDLQEVRREDIVWIDLAQDRDRLRALVRAIMNIRVQ